MILNIVMPCVSFCYIYHGELLVVNGKQSLVDIIRDVFAGTL